VTAYQLVEVEADFLVVIDGNKLAGIQFSIVLYATFCKFIFDRKDLSSANCGWLITTKFQHGIANLMKSLRRPEEGLD
jgi:hypothetical protein